MLKQAYRDVAVSSPLGEDTLVFRRMVAVEQVSTLFTLELDLLAARPGIDFNALLGQNMTVRLRVEEGERYYNGFVQSFSHVGGSGRYAGYRAVLRPWLWFLTRNRNCRIFQDKTVPDIVKAVLREHGFTDIEDRLSGSYLPWEYCVQYQESDFAFVSRLLEHEGIYYHFTHQNGRHTLVLGDEVGAHDHLRPSARLRFNPTARWREGIRSVDEWMVTREVTSGAYTVDDFDFERPRAELRTGLSMARPHALSAMEVFEYPGGMANMKSGQRSTPGPMYARHRLEEIQAGHERIEGRTTVRELACGQLFTLTNHPVEEQNREYLVLSTVAEIRSDEFAAGEDGGSGGEPYTCRFTVLSSRERFRPPRVTPWPVMRGPQTAIVSGKAGEEIWTDKYGRIKVLFHWDRTGKADETSSCWIRVAQAWAGKRWGAQFLPRVGQEVIVDFLDGDPNRPVVTGSLYNGDVMPPFALPEHATRSGVRTDSVKGTGANELRFEDKAGKEQVYLHAQRNQDNRVRASSRESVGGNRHLTVGGSHSLMVEANRHDIVWTDAKQNVDSTLSQMVGLEHHEEVGENYALKAGLEIALEAGLTLTLKASGGFITIGPTGVTISGNVVLINSGGSPGSLTAKVQEPDEAQYASDGSPGGKGGAPHGRRKSRLAANRGRIAQVAKQKAAAEWGAFRYALDAAERKRQALAAAHATALNTQSAESVKKSTNDTDGHWKDDSSGKIGSQYDYRKYKYFGSEEAPASPRTVEGKISIGKSISNQYNKIGDDAANIRIGAYDANYAIGYSHNFTDNSDSYGFNAGAQVALLKGEAKGTAADGLIEGGVKGEALSASVGLNAAYVHSATFDGVKADAGGEVNLVKITGSAQVNITGKTVYDNTLGHVIGFLNPDWKKAPESWNHGVVIGGEAEAGVGAAAKASAEYNAKTGLFKMGAKAGFGPSAGVSVIFGIK